MTQMSDQDMILLGAYLDDELDPVERAAFERRLGRETSLALAHEDLADLKKDLRALRPMRDTAPPRAVSIRQWAAAGALAAGLAIAALLGVGQVDRKPSATEIHAGFLTDATASIGDEIQDASVSSSAELPDLGVAGLSLVAERRVGRVRAGHYVGRNGCRLTLLVGEASIDDPDPASMQAAWHNGATPHVLVARDMDPRRFETITAYLREGIGTGGETILASRLQDARACG
ncbi:zf-HC2 domain-containing protein [Limimaricola sp. ASW11-118]|uniref:Zf-HC2 domain-containing protein n=1 Tax=Limimaricola litoreus TaxID=2955316 RepID=A0A9X2FSP0_9RHOB|nr:zf-HC2 domain-containing protein [Limimaricola litoreus]MCP1169940.1 zf-HC2 domain-containing protein [Limimaricola litoreus]